MRRYICLAACALAMLAAAPAPRDGSHDFDYLLGDWSVHYQKLAHPLAGSHDWVRFAGPSRIRSLWDGVGDVEDGYLDLPNNDPRSNFTVRLYDPATQNWALYLGTGTEVFASPQIGHFDANGVGTFMGRDTVSGKAVLVRQQWSRRDGNPHFEQALSIDDGKTYETNWIADYIPVQQCCTPPQQYGRPHDFDFEFGAWKAHLKRILHPLQHDTTWVQYDGVSIVHPMVNGHENVGELEVHGAAGSIGGISIRTYDVDARQWNIRWVNAKAGIFTSPMIGGFTADTGTFYGNDTLYGKPIVVRFVFSEVTRSRFHFEQAFSADDGKTWEVNWIADFSKEQGK